MNKGFSENGKMTKKGICTEQVPWSSKCVFETKRSFHANLRQLINISFARTRHNCTAFLRTRLQIAANFPFVLSCNILRDAKTRKREAPFPSLSLALVKNRRWLLPRRRKIRWKNSLSLDVEEPGNNKAPYSRRLWSGQTAANLEHVCFRVPGTFLERGTGSDEAEWNEKKAERNSR